MKIFFLGSRAEELYPQYKKIISILRNQGHTVIDDWMEVSTEEDSLNFEKAYQRNMNFIKKSDIVVAEISQISSGVSFLIASALNEKRPVLALYNKETNKIPPSTIRGSSRKNRLLIYEEYTDSDVEKVLTKLMQNTKELIDTKFILIIPPEIDRYLEWASGQRRMHKAQIVRSAIEDMMETDKEWLATQS